MVTIRGQQSSWCRLVAAGEELAPCTVREEAAPGRHPLTGSARRYLLRMSGVCTQESGMVPVSHLEVACASVFRNIAFPNFSGFQSCM